MKYFKITLLLSFFLFLSGCADNPSLLEAVDMNKVGFWYGYWHGLTFFFSFIGSLIYDDISMYAIYNSGSWYDFGYYSGVLNLVVITKVYR